MKNRSNKFRWARFTAFSLACTFLLTSCHDDDVNVVALPSPVVEGQATHNTLDFNWEPIDGATQYGYTLAKENGDLVETDVTTKHTLSFSDLAPATTYDLSVWAYGAVFGENGTSAVTVYSATTNPLSTLPAPDISVVEDGTRWTFQWVPIYGAEGYSYVLKGNGVQRGVTTETEISFRHLEAGDYTLSVCAIVNIDGYEPNGEMASVDFTVTTVRNELWRKQGTYTSKLLGTTHPATLIAYDDDSYVLQNWYGVDGYDLNFDLDGKNIVLDTSTYVRDVSTSCYAVPTGLEFQDGVMWIYTNGMSIINTSKRFIRLCNCRANVSTDTYNDVFQWEE